MALAARGAEASLSTDAPLAWDAITKTVRAHTGEATAFFSFLATNPSATPVEIRRVNVTCDCTTVHIPARPWIVAPGETTTLAVTLEFAGKSGVVRKTLVVETDRGSETLTINVEIPSPAPESEKAPRAPVPPPP